MSKIMRTLIVILMLAGLGAVIALAIISRNAPATSGVVLATEDAQPAAACLSDNTGGCVVFPTITGQNVDGAAFSAPEDFAKPLNIVILPFDREQQERALNWLPLGQSLAAEYADVGYYSVAALPDLSPFVRGLVIGGLQLGVRDEAVRTVTVITFLEDQARFIAALGLADNSQMAVVVVDDTRRLLYRAVGDYDEAQDSALRQFINDLH